MTGTFTLSATLTFAYVFLRAFQQLNVVNGNYLRVLPTSLLMGLGDVSLVLLMVHADTLWIGLWNGVGGALGCWAAMAFHKRLDKRRDVRWVGQFDFTRFLKS